MTTSCPHVLCPKHVCHFSLNWTKERSRAPLLNIGSPSTGGQMHMDLWLAAACSLLPWLWCLPLDSLTPHSGPSKCSSSSLSSRFAKPTKRSCTIIGRIMTHEHTHINTAHTYRTHVGQHCYSSLHTLSSLSRTVVEISNFGFLAGCITSFALSRMLKH